MAKCPICDREMTPRGKNGHGEKVFFCEEHGSFEEFKK